MKTRIGAFGACLVLLAALPAHAADLVRVGRAANGFSYAPIEIGNEAGIYRKLGLDVTITTFSGAAKLDQAMIGGATDVALTGATDIAYSVKGAPTRTVGAIVTHPVNMAIIAGNNIKTVADLKGKKIGISQAGTLTSWMAEELSRSQGWGPHGVQMVAVGGVLPAMMAALVTGQVDAVASHSSLGLILQEKHRGRTLITVQQYAPGFPTLTIESSTDMIKNHPDVLRRFLKGWYQSVTYILSHKAQAVAAGTKITGLDAKLMAVHYENTRSMWSRDGRLTPAQLKRLAQAVVDMGVLKTEPNLAPYYDPRFLP